MGRGASYVPDKPRILFLDIETRLFEAYTFGIRDQHITHKQLKNVKDGRNIHCVGLKWAGEKKVRVPNEWGDGYRGMLEIVHEALCEADAVMTYNGARFDIPKLAGQFAIEGMPPPPPLTQVDIWKTARNLGYISSKLDYVAPILGLGAKIKHPGLEMWIAAREGCPKARKMMIRYCAGDVRLTEEVYDRLRPYITTHPHLGFTPRNCCPSCGDNRIQRRGVRRTKAMFIERLHCQSCGAWTDGARSKVAHTLAALAA